VACAAPPEAACAKHFYRWDKTTLTVGIIERDRAFLGGKLKRAEAALVRALQHLNATGAGLTLSITEETPDIAIHLLDVSRGQTIPTGSLLRGKTMANAITALEVEGSTITGAAIGFSNTIPIRQYESVMLEEITQALGLITDIRNLYYQSRSILSQDADNSLKTLGEQDRMALIRHYPPP
tara:strand:- start:13033 stop:13575 length:543 start_codon:yes stop_codon:yes gene_type:complete